MRIRSLSHRKYRPPQVAEGTFDDNNIMWLRHRFFVLWDRLLGAGDVRSKIRRQARLEKSRRQNRSQRRTRFQYPATRSVSLRARKIVSGFRTRPKPNLAGSPS